MYNKIAIIGGGILGLSIAYKLQFLKPKSKLFLFEKESEVGAHQSGRNSGVLHCGLPYKPNSLKAKLAVSGIRQMTDFCIKNSINHEICGKVVVATNHNEVKYLENLAQIGAKNKLKGLKFLSNKELSKIEPNVSAKKSLLVPEEGIVDYKHVMDVLLKKIIEKNAKIFLSTEILKIDKNNKILCKNYEGSFDLVINCSGLFSDKNYTRYTGNKSPLKIVPFRGEYYMLKDQYKDIINNLVYPVPDPQFPFLGVHFTRMINNDREVGPNAVLAFKREGYSNKDFSFSDTLENLTYPGLLKFIKSNFGFCLDQLKTSFFSSHFIKKAKKLVPDIDSNMFKKGNSGVRAQAMNNSGNLIMDFKIVRINNQIHVLNAPSPGATASLSIADYILKNYIN